MTLLDRLDRGTPQPAAPVIPVIVLDDPLLAVPLARACAAGGVTILEVTLRTAAGLEAIRRIAAEVPQVLVGAGTVLRPADVQAVAQAGARFAVSPGFDRSTVEAARDCGIEPMPGVVTPSEVMAAMDAGLSLLKFFPASAAGGVAMLQALRGPFPSIRFCPTGGIGAEEAPGYLALPNVVAVGGSWLTPAAAIAAGDWAQITARCAAASKLASR
jgi:2-dehydro-3-deoxyphosphogluconate aldolase / (4S)-4-hydroxy-2-oxoglutarate aldolase